MEIEPRHSLPFARVPAFAGWVAVALLAMLALALPATLPAGAGAATTGCNGFQALCARRFDEVVFPASHNSMADSPDGFTWPSQGAGISAQLEQGVRMLLIDTHHWETPSDIARATAKMAPADRARFVGRLHEPSVTPVGVFLCHVYCGLGSTPLTDALGEIREFLESHPHEVLGIFFEDYVTPAETALAFQTAGLIPFVYTPIADAPWPTLGAMIATNHRLVVFAEHSGGSPAWYQYGWSVVQDTRYDVPNDSEFDCALNRGTADAPLFLLNHWIAKGEPSPTDASRVNAFAYLLARARACQGERGRLPNFIAVNFAEQGDLLAVVNALNGVG